jgi:hypothetical protein
LIVLVLLSTTVLGCATQYKLVMKPDVEPVNDGGESPVLATKRYEKAMVIPPSGKPMGTYDELIAQFETEFIKSGMTLISSVKSADLQAAPKEEDLAKTVKMVEQSGAQVAIKIIDFEWTEKPELTRFFALKDPQSDTLTEVNQNEYLAINGPKYAFGSVVLHFSGKIVDVATAQVLETFKIHTAANWNLGAQYTTNVVQAKKGWELAGESYSYKDSRWLAAAKKKAESKIIGIVAHKVMHDRSGG